MDEDKNIQNLAKKKILFVEDDPVLSKMYKIKLEDAGYQVLIVDNGNTGLDVIAKESIDLLLLDIMMPQLSGIDMLSMVRESEENRDLPVIIITNLTGEAERQRAKELGVTDYLLKADLTPTQLLDKVNAVIGRN